MLRQQAACLSDRVYDGVGEIVGLEVSPHHLGQFLPERLAALLVHASVSNDREFLRTRRDKDQNGVALAGLRHAKSLELQARIGHRVGDFAALDEDANFARSCCFRGGDRRRNAIVFQFSEKFLRAHDLTSRIRRPRRRNRRRLR